MKTNKNRITLLMSLRICLCVTLLAFASCKSCKKDADPENTLPPATQTGANTFGAVINGQAWVPNGESTIPITRPINGGYDVPNKVVYLRLYSSNGVNMYLYVKNVIEPGRYLLNKDTSPRPTVINPENYGLYTTNGATIDDPDYNYITTSQITGYVDFTVVNPTTTQLSGTFEFEGIDFPSGKKIKVTNGRFDVNQTTRPQ